MVYEKLTKEGSFNVFGEGSQTRDFGVCNNIAKFYVKAIKNDIRNEIVNLGTGKSTTIKEIVEIVGEILGISPKINYLPARSGEINNFVADTRKLEKLFGSVPKTDIHTGLKRTFNWLNTVK